MKPHHHHPVETLTGKFKYPIYSPKGSIEGALFEAAGGDVVQLVFEPREHAAAGSPALLPAGDVTVEAHAEQPSRKGKAQHRVYRFERLVSIDGRAPSEPSRRDPASFSGTVVRLNYARHGEANGVVLDSGHFVHTKPDGMATLGLAIGDRVEATGKASALADGTGFVVEARHVNGTALEGPRDAKAARRGRPG